MQLVLDTQGMSLQKRNGCFFLVSDERSLLVNPARVSSIAVTTYCNLTSAAIRLAIEKEVPILFIDGFGNVEGRLWSASFGHLATVRRKQAVFDQQPEATDWAIDLLRQKTLGQLSVLACLKDQYKAQSTLLTAVETALQQGLNDLQTVRSNRLIDCRASLMGYEGTMARQYWQAVATCLPAPWTLNGRSRQPALDPFNAALNYLYGMLYGTVETALFSAGLDPYLGLLHADQYNRPTLTYDLIEPFRPWIDRLLIEAVQNHSLQPTFFTTDSTKGVTVTKTGKTFLIPLLNRHLHEMTSMGGRRAKRRTHIFRLAGALYNLLNDQVAAI